MPHSAFYYAGAMAVDSEQRLTSRANPLLKAVRKAARRGRATEDGLWLAESPHLLDEAVRSGVEIASVLLADSAAEPVGELAKASAAPLRCVSGELFAEIATTDNSQGVLALVRPRLWRAEQVLEADGPALILDGVADPGNVGAAARSAEAFGAAGLLLTRGCAYPENPKTLRASAGALFRLPFAAGLRAEAIVEACAAAGRPLLAASARHGRPIDRAPLTDAAIVIGSEAHGVGPVLASAAEAIHIPTRRVESLNAAAAAAIILYQASRSARDQ